MTNSIKTSVASCKFMGRYLSLDALDGIDHHGNSAFRQRLKTLLCVDVHTRQPAAKSRVTVVPAHHHLRPTQRSQTLIISHTVLYQNSFSFSLRFSHLPVCFNISNILAWKTGSTASTLTPCQQNKQSESLRSVKHSKACCQIHRLKRWKDIFRNTTVIRVPEGFLKSNISPAQIKWLPNCQD